MQDVDEGLGGIHCSSSATLVSAMRILANDIQSDDGVANAAISEAADRLEQLQRAAVAVLEWYFRDGSVGGAEDPMYELMRSCGVTEEWLRRK